MIEEIKMDGWQIVTPVDIAGGKYRIIGRISTAEDEHLYKGLEIIDDGFTDVVYQEDVAIKIESIQVSKTNS